MAYSSKQVVENFRKWVKEEGAEPTLKEIKDKFYPREKGYDEMRRTRLARLLVLRLRNLLKKEEGEYFYHVKVNGKRRYKLLQDPQEFEDTFIKIEEITKGFLNSVNNILEETNQRFTNKQLGKGRGYLKEIEVQFKALNTIFSVSAGMVKNRIKQLARENEK